MQRESLQVIDDQVGAPTGAELLADITAHAISKILASPQLAGLYHLVADGQISWHGYAGFIIEHARTNGAVIKTESGNIIPVSSEAFPAAAKRPHNSRLDTSKLQAAFGITLPPWQQGVTRMLTEILENKND